MNLLPPVKCAAYNKLQKNHLSVKEVATEVMQDAVEEIQGGAGDDEITDVSISCVMVPGRSVIYITQWSCSYNINWYRQSIGCWSDEPIL